ncbi:hypothetical protein HZS_5285, partial [Henneguya salminicola]
NKRVPTQSPQKKKQKNANILKNENFLSLKELFMSKKTEKKCNPLQFLSSDKEEESKNLTSVKPKLHEPPPINDLKSNKIDEILCTPESNNPETGLKNETILNLTPIKSSTRPPSISLENSRKRLFYQQKLETIKEPAYKRFAPLYTASPQCPNAFEKSAKNIHLSTSLYLPRKYQRLNDMFRAVETILHVYKKRDEVCEFSKLKKGVETMAKMVFNKIHLAQILFLLPDAYKIYIGEPPNQSPSSKSSKLIIEMTDSNEEEAPITVTHRRETFNDLLMKKTLFYHNKFLLELGVNIDASQIKRWHPKFMIEEVPDIESVELPELPKTKVYTAKDMLKMTCYTEDEIMLNILTAASNNCSNDTENASIENTISSEDNTIKHIPKNLLEKIRLKEKIKSQKLMLRDPTVDVLLTKMQRLPEIIRCVYNYFVTEKKPYLTLNSVLVKIKQSNLPDANISIEYSLKIGAIQEYINLIQKHIPEWMKTVNLHGVPYLGIKNDVYNINDAITKINSCIDELS